MGVQQKKKRKSAAAKRLRSATKGMTKQGRANYMRARKQSRKARSSTRKQDRRLSNRSKAAVKCKSPKVACVIKSLKKDLKGNHRTRVTCGKKSCADRRRSRELTLSQRTGMSKARRGKVLRAVKKLSQKTKSLNKAQSQLQKAKRQQQKRKKSQQQQKRKKSQQKRKKSQATKPTVRRSSRVRKPTSRLIQKK